MPGLAQLSDTTEYEIARLGLGAQVAEAGMTERWLPHAILGSMMSAIRRTIERLDTVKRARVFDFAPDSMPAMSVVSWFDVALARLLELSEAGPNWDGYGAPAIKVAGVLASFQFLNDVMTHSGSPPAIVATGAGNIQFEWHVEPIAIDVEIGSDYSYCATLLVDGDEKEEWTGDVRLGVDPGLARAIGRVGRAPAS